MRPRARAAKRGIDAGAPRRFHSRVFHQGSRMIALLLQAATPAAAPAPPPWAPVERATLSGGRSVSASAYSADGASRLVVRCDRGKDAVVSIQFIPREQTRRFGVQPVALQFDGGTPLVDNWEVMGAGLIERDDAAMTTLSTGIARARSIKLHSVDPEDKPIDLVFAGPGSEAPIRRVVEACGFTFGQLPKRAVAPAPSPEPTPAP